MELLRGVITKATRRASQRGSSGACYKRLEVGKPLSSFEDRFAQAQQDVNRLPSRPDSDTLLKLYALYKQATKGDATGDPPGGFDYVARAKFDAWRAVKGTSTQDAIER